jgi:hypothetical protein
MGLKSHKDSEGKDKLDSGFYTTIIVARQKRHEGFGTSFRHKISWAWEGGRNRVGAENLTSFTKVAEKI